MKLGELKSLGHNIADSLASGTGLMIGVYETDVFAAATASATGSIRVDFLAGLAAGGKVSSSTERAIALYKEALPSFCKKQGLNLDEIKVLEAEFGVDRAYGRHFTVTVESTTGKRSTDLYVGVPGRRARGHRTKAFS